jgi:uncharacterized membrane protein YtjA (UPF0391 family)
MLNLVVTLLIIALIAAVLGFGGIAGVFITLFLFLISVIFGAIGRRPIV